MVIMASLPWGENMKSEQRKSEWSSEKQAYRGRVCVRETEREQKAHVCPGPFGSVRVFPHFWGLKLHQAFFWAPTCV